MAKFIYRMQNILDIKYKLETQAKTAFSVAAAALNKEEEKLEALRMRERDYERKARELAKEIPGREWIGAVIGGAYGILPFLPVYGLS